MTSASLSGRTARAWLLSAAIFLSVPIEAAEPDRRVFRSEFRHIYDGLRKQVCGPFIEPGAKLAETPRFESDLSRSEQRGFLEALNDCAFTYARREIAFIAADLWVRREPKRKWPQIVRLGYGVEFGRPDSSLEALDYFAAKDRKFLRRLPLAAVKNLLLAADLVDDSGNRKLAVLELLADARYRPAPPHSDDSVRFAHARLLLARGETARAKDILEPVTDIHWIILMRVDRLFEPLHADASFAARLELQSAMERDLARTRDALDANPDLILAVDQYVTALTMARRFDEALVLTDAALAREAADGRAYVDGNVHRRLLLESRARLLLELGRSDEAVSSLLDAANQHEYRRSNVSQMLVLGRYLVDLGRGTQALALLPNITGTSRREQAWVEAIRACAGALAGSDVDRIRGLDYLDAHENDEPEARSWALLCSDDIDGAAKLMIRRLGKQRTSGSALMAMQSRLPLRSDELPYRKLLRERFTTVRTRADVLAAAHAVGRIDGHPLTVGGDF